MLLAQADTSGQKKTHAGKNAAGFAGNGSKSTAIPVRPVKSLLNSPFQTGTDLKDDAQDAN